jgi:hypothetical protein
MRYFRILATVGTCLSNRSFSRSCAKMFRRSASSVGRVADEHDLRQGEHQVGAAGAEADGAVGPGGQWDTANHIGYDRQGRASSVTASGRPPPRLASPRLFVAICCSVAGLSVLRKLPLSSRAVMQIEAPFASDENARACVLVRSASRLWPTTSARITAIHSSGRPRRGGWGPRGWGLARMLSLETREN